MQIRVLLAGNCPLKNQGIHTNLSTVDNWIVVETTTELDKLPELYAYHQSNLLLAVLDGWEDQFGALSHRLPTTNIIGLSGQNGQSCLALIRNSVINGCLPETATPVTVAQAIRAVTSGYTWFSQSLFKTILRPTPQSNEEPSILTDQELAMLRLVAQEETNKYIAQAMGIGVRNVGYHLRAIYEKLGVMSRLGAALKAERLGLLDK